MGEIVGAAVVAHVPTIVMPEDLRRELTDGEDFTLGPGLALLRSGCLDRLVPDTVVVFDTHWFTTCLLYTSPSPRDATLARMPSSA